jgi:uncharacterized DUF497 family protein
MTFEWDEVKDRANLEKHGVDFASAREAFFDPNRLLQRDSLHSTPDEERFFCYSKVGRKVLTVRFTFRMGRIRIFGAAYWRQGAKLYEIHRQGKDGHEPEGR